jgi:hypothetical protein
LKEGEKKKKKEEERKDEGLEKSCLDNYMYI